MAMQSAEYNKPQVKLSVTSKLDGIRSWSLQALETCPGSLGSNGELVDACRGCYATQGNYRYPNVKLEDNIYIGPYCIIGAPPEWKGKENDPTPNTNSLKSSGLLGSE